MKTITMREFNRNFYKHIDTLPLVITRYGKPYMNVTSCHVNKSKNSSQPFGRGRSNKHADLDRCRDCDVLFYKHGMDAGHEFVGK